MEFMRFEIDRCHVLVGHLDPRRIGVWIKGTFDVQACTGCCAADELDDGLVADQGLASPVLRDEREQAVLDFVPLAGSRRQMTDGDRQT